MRSILTILLFSAFLTACGSSDDNSHHANSSATNDAFNNEFSPTITQPESPPLGTTLPADLHPPQ